MMFPNNDKISITQLINILILGMVGVGILALPRILVEGAGTDGWIILMSGGFLVIIIAFLYGYIVKSFPGKNWFDILAINLTKPVAYLVTLYFFIHFILMAGFTTRIFIAVVKVMLLPRTPRGVLVLSLLLVVGYLGRKGIETLGRLAEVLVVPLAVIILGLFAVSWAGFQFSNLFPVFQTDFIDIIKGIPNIFFSFVGIEVMLVFGRFVNEPQNSMKAPPMAVAIVLISYVILNATMLGVLGEQQIRYIVWPFIAAFETVSLGGAFIENVGVVVMGIWVFIAFTTIAPMYLAGSIMASNLLHAKEYNYLALPLLPFVYFISYWSDSTSDVYKELNVINIYTSYGVLVIVPFIVFLSMIIRKTHKTKEKKI